MNNTAIIGVGMIPVGEHWDASLRKLAYDAAEIALKDANNPKIDAIYVGNAYASTFNKQTQLGSLIADYLGFSGIEAYTVEAADASGGAAIRTAHMAVASGAINTALVIGVEKATDIMGAARTKARAISLDADYETPYGATLTAMAALLMRRYMHEYDLDLSVFEGFSVNAHANGKANSFAMYRNTLREGSFARAPMVADPVSLFDGAPDGDGAAALVITRTDIAPDRVGQPIQITASAATTDKFMLQERGDMLSLQAIEKSVDAALKQANLSRNDIDLFELHDAFTILSALSLEAAGFAERGHGWEFAQSGSIKLNGQLPISTFGGLKSRGNPAGASGVYQAVEAVLQLRNQAGDNQVANANAAMIQSVGGLGSTVFTHILQI
ncbi:MAG: beta-ketoacyl synthase N-terminal-like domain-containing protein [Phototrophicaceae bacterium]